MKCINCKKDLDGNKRKYCCKKCADHYLYLKKKIYYLKKGEIWAKEHPKKRLEIAKKSCKKYRIKNKEKIKKHINEFNKKYPEKYRCRNLTRLILKGELGMKKYNPLKKECKHCGSIKNLDVHHEIYPQGSKKIKEAMDVGKIFMLCRLCHRRLHLK